MWVCMARVLDANVMSCKENVSYTHIEYCLGDDEVDICSGLNI